MKSLPKEQKDSTRQPNAMLNISTRHIGRITKLNGYMGRLRLMLEPSLVTAPEIGEGDWIFLKINLKPVPFQIEWIEDHSPEFYLVKLRHIDSLEQAKELIGLEVGDLVQDNGPESSNEETQEQSDYEKLQGFQLLDQDHREVGLISDVHVSEFQVLLTVELSSGQESLVPFHQELVISENHKLKVLQLQIHDGLLDI